MHFPSMELYVILLSILGGSRTAHAVPTYEDAFGPTNYGIECGDHVYDKAAIYSAAKWYCDHYTLKLGLRPNRNGYRWYITDYKLKGNINYEFPQGSQIIPIIPDGKLYDYGASEKLHSEYRNGKITPGVEFSNHVGVGRLVVDEQCNIKGGFIDHFYDEYKPRNQIEFCKVLESREDRYDHSISHSSSYRNQRHQSPESSSGSSSGSSSDKSRGSSHDKSRGSSPGQSREQSPERNP